MLIRLILLFLVVAAVLWLLKRLFSDDSDSESPDSPSAPNPKAENMRQCKYCGTHVPESLLIISNDQPYCSQDHADRDQS